MGLMRPFLDEIRVPHRSWDFRKFFGIPAFFCLLFHLRRSRPDVIVQVGQRAISTFAIALSPAKHKLYQCLHHHAGTHPEWLWRANYAAVSRIFDKMTFLTDWCRNEATSIYPPMRHSTQVIYPPVPLTTPKTEADQRAARKALCLPEKTYIVGAVGRQVPVKRFDIVLDVAKHVLKVQPQTQFLLVGDGPLHESLRSRAEAEGIDQSLIWLKWQSDMDTVYQAMNTLLFVTDYDAFGMVPCESLAVGTPAICSVSNGGLLELLQGEESFSEHDISQLARSIVGLSDSQRAADNLKRGRAAISKFCSPPQHVAKFLAILEAKKEPR